MTKTIALLTFLITGSVSYAINVDCEAEVFNFDKSGNTISTTSYNTKDFEIDYKDSKSILMHSAKDSKYKFSYQLISGDRTTAITMFQDKSNEDDGVVNEQTTIESKTGSVSYRVSELRNKKSIVLKELVTLECKEKQ